jgi:two-component system nitrate/nitrite response regulator NarL
VVALRYPFLRDAFCAGLRRFPTLGAIARSDDGRTALDLIERHRPGVAIVDRDLPTMDAVAIVRAIAAAGLPTRVIVIAADAVESSACTAIEAGAAGYFTMLAPMPDIMAGIHRVMRGATAVGAEFVGVILSRAGGRTQGGTPTLSLREQEVLCFLTDGCSAPQIAASLHLSVPTIKTHLTRLYLKLGVSDRAAAVAVGFRSGLVS